MNGITRVVLPIGVNAVQSVNCYVLADGDRVTVVDCGVWRPDLPDGGLAALTAGLNGAGYALARRRAHRGHARAHRPLRPRGQGHGGDRRAARHARDDRPGLREVPPPRHRPRAPPRHLRGPRGVRGRADGPRRPPHPLAALPALGGGGVHPAARGRAPRDRRRRLGRRAHARPLAGPRLPVLARAGRAALRRPPAARHHPARDVRARLRRRPAAQLPRLAAPRRRPAPDARAARPRPPVRRPGRADRGHLPHQAAEAGEGAPGHRGGAVVGGGAGRPARRQGDPRPPAPARDQRDALAHRLSAVVRRGRTAHPAGRRLRVVRLRPALTGRKGGSRPPAGVEVSRESASREVPP